MKPWVVQIFWPLMTHSSPSSTALVPRLARSEPASGSLKPWHQAISPERILGRKNCFCSSGPHCRMVGPTRVSPKKSARRGAPALANSSLSTTASMVLRPLPPYSAGQVAQIHPPSNRVVVHSFWNCTLASASMANPGSNQPSGRLSSSHFRISTRKASASGG